MPLHFETERLDALKKLAAERYGEITDAEVEVLRQSASAEELAPPNSQEQQVVRAAFLRWLATDRDAAAYVDPIGLRVYSATVSSTLNLNLCKVPFSLRFLRCTFQGELLLGSAEVPALYLSDCRAEVGISANAVRVRGNVFIRRLEGNGEIKLMGARIDGDLSCNGTILFADGKAFSADRAKVTGGVFLREGFSCSGEIRLPGAEIGGDLSLNGACLTAGGVALNAEGVKLGGSVFLSEGFSCFGAIRFLNAHIGGDLQCQGATLTGEEFGLLADGAEISGDVVFRNHFSCAGTVRIPGTYIGGDIDCSGAHIGVLSCEHMRLNGSLIWTSIQRPDDSYLNMLGAVVKVLHDDAVSWPPPGNLVLKGLEYKDLVMHDPSMEEHLLENFAAPQRKLDADERIKWLKLQDDEDRVDPQPWIWLAKLFKEKDDIAGHRRIICAYRCLKARAMKNPLQQLVGLCLAHLERNPWNVLLAFVPLLLLGAILLSSEASAGNIAPTEREAYVAWAAGKPFPTAYPRFSPVIYTLENELPVVKFGMDEKWAPDPNLPTRGRFWTYWILLAGFRWFLILAGWIQGVLLSIGVSRRFLD